MMKDSVMSQLEAGALILFDTDHEMSQVRKSLQKSSGKKKKKRFDGIEKSQLIFSSYNQATWHLSKPRENDVAEMK